MNIHFYSYLCTHIAINPEQHFINFHLEHYGKTSKKY